MKKLIFLIPVFLMLASCNEPNTKDYTETTFENSKESYRPIGAERVQKFVYEGHRYLMFSSPHCHGFGIVHDPNCECNAHQ